MKKSLFFALASAVACFASSLTAAEVGQPAPDFELPAADGKTHKLSDFQGKFVVLEWLNHQCPFVVKHYGSGNMQALQKDMASQDVVWLSICSSAPGKQGHMTAEEALGITAEVGAAPAAVLLDETGEVGKAYGAKRTPEMYLISPEGVLIYHGAIDSIPSAEQSDVPKAENYLLAAFSDAKAGNPVANPLTKPYGCGVKYK